MRKTLYAVAVVIAFAYWPITSVIAQSEAKRYREAAWAHFQKRCKENAGEKIYRVVENVDGLLLLKPRKRPTDQEFRDQYWMGDPYGHDADGRLEIVAYLAALNKDGLPVIHSTPRAGYKFVEIESTDGGFIQYRRDDPRKPPTEHPQKSRSATFGVIWRDISTAEDRQFWTAGGKLQVIDLATNDVVAERVGYLLEAEFGSTSGGRRPWLFARLHYSERACPPFRRQALINREFVERVVKPQSGSRDGK